MEALPGGGADGGPAWWRMSVVGPGICLKRAGGGAEKLLSAITLPPATGLAETYEVKEIKAHFTRSELQPGFPPETTTTTVQTEPTATTRPPSCLLTSKGCTKVEQGEETTPSPAS
ncbi:unnamed protein product [Boreogadus saida]